MTTIKDISEDCGFSIATVSRVLNNQRNVDENIRKKVLQSAKALDYKPNVLAKLLRTQDSNFIMCIVPSDNGLMFNIFTAMQERFHENGYQLLLYPKSLDSTDDSNLIQSLESGLIAGIVLINSGACSGNILSNLSKQVPLVLQGEYDEHTKTSVITIDYIQAFKDGTKFLIKNGHTQIAVLSFMPSLLSSRKKLQGYKIALEQAGIPYNANLIKEVNHNFDSSLESAILSLFELEEKPTAIMCYSDIIAAKCIRILHQNNIHVPEDCSVMGYDNSKISDLTTPTITTIGISQAQMGKRSADLLLEQIKYKERYNEIIIMPHKLYLRETVNKRKDFD